MQLSLLAVLLYKDIPLSLEVFYMKFLDKLNKMHKNTDILDMGFAKWTMFFFTLMLVKFWPVLLSLDWYWYLLASLVLAIRPLYHFFKK